MSVLCRCFEPLRWSWQALIQFLGRCRRPSAGLALVEPTSTALVVRPSPPRPRVQRGVGALAVRPTQSLFGVEEDPPYLPLIELSPEFLTRLLSATSPRTLGERFPPFLQQYLRRPDLQALNPNWPIEARLTRALRSGASARRVLDGVFDKQVRACLGTTDSTWCCGASCTVVVLSPSSIQSILQCWLIKLVSWKLAVCHTDSPPLLKSKCF